MTYEFQGGTDGSNPQAALTLDPAGSLYGTTVQGGSPGWGTVFKLAPNGNGTWTETILYNFQGGTDGGDPNTTLAQDSAGNLYGATEGGGVCNSSNQCGGLVFELSPQQNGTWVKTTLYAFPLNSQNQPSAEDCSSLVFDSAGNLYGTTLAGGSGGYGTAFQLAPNPDGTWTENVLYNFADSLDGGNPSGGVLFDSAGNLYGEAEIGGSFACPRTGCGTIFRLTPQSNGTWTFSVVHTLNGFDGSKGEYPYGGLTMDSGGNFYGMTNQGGNMDCFGLGYGCGTIFELTPTSSGATFKILGDFDGKYGAFRQAGVILDSEGNLWGTTTAGGNLNCPTGNGYGCGVVFELTP